MPAHRIIGVYLCWLVNFYCFSILFVIGIPATAAFLSAICGTELSRPSIIRFFETLFSAITYTAILGGPLAGITAPFAMTKDTNRRREWTLVGGAIVGLWAAGRWFPLFLASLVSDSRAIAVPVILVLTSFVAAFVFVIAYFVNRYAVWLTVKILDTQLGLRLALAVLTAALISTYTISYQWLRNNGTLGFQDRYYVQGGAFFSIDTPTHIRAEKKSLEWLYWIPAEIELYLSDPEVELAGPMKHYYPNGTVKRGDEIILPETN